jgi:hypothetical protein
MGAALDGEVTGLLRRAAGWRLLGLLFERPRRGWHDEVEALARESDDADLRAAAARARGAGEGSYLATLGPGGSTSPREVAWRGMHDPGHVLAELAGCYDAFGYRPLAEDPADHVAVEIGFMGYLTLKEAYALARGDAAARRTTREAFDGFGGEHLDVLAAELPARLASGPPHLAAAASVLRKWRPTAARRRLDLVRDPGPPSVDDEPLACPGACAGTEP